MVLVLMISMTLLVLAAYSVPANLHCHAPLDIAANGTLSGTHLDSGHTETPFRGPAPRIATMYFMCVHGYIMYFAIPPVICVTLMVYSFIFLLFVLHGMDFMKLEASIAARLFKFQSQSAPTANRPCADTLLTYLAFLQTLLPFLPTRARP